MNKQEYETNLHWANNALRHVKYTCVIGASNRHDDMERTSNWSNDSVKRMRKQSAARTATTWGELVRLLAKDASDSRCGNCGEQAALAFEYLRLTLGATPIEYMTLASQRQGGGGVGVCDGDHVFVVIGRKAGGNPGTVSSTLDIQNWNPETVICDPWANEVYPAFDFGVKSTCGGAWHRLKSALQA
ncbi:MAG: hypothetical protein OEZ43_07795 [Gammaproteobacteria bacterium]|nr:hypothetical protein [Gammaproteobacteria bacterium]